MPIMSYLAYPIQGAKKELFQKLQNLDHCEVLPADNEDILILITDTPDDKTEKQLHNKLKTLKSLQALSMT